MTRCLGVCKPACQRKLQGCRAQQTAACAGFCLLLGVANAHSCISLPQGKTSLAVVFVASQETSDHTDEGDDEAFVELSDSEDERTPAAAKKRRVMPAWAEPCAPSLRLHMAMRRC